MVTIGFRVDGRRGEEWRLPRCLAIAEGLRESEVGCEIIFMSEIEDASAIEAKGYRTLRIQATNALEDEAEALGAMVGEHGIDVLLIDRAGPDESYLKSLRGSVGLLALIDDQRYLGSYPVSALINPHVNAHMQEYRTDADTLMLMGTEFAPLPSDFDPHLDEARDGDGRARRVLIHFGGTDFRGAILKCVKALQDLEEQFNVTIVISPEYRHGKELATLIGLDQRFVVITEPDASARRFSSCDIALSSPDHLPELLFFRKPAILISEKDWHLQIAQYAARVGMAHDSGLAADADIKDIRIKASRLLSDPSERARLSARGEELVDGLGRFRIADEILRLHRARAGG